jgi:plasmid stabilization system protein ParE
VEEKQSYVVEITAEAEIYYLQLLEYLYQTHSGNSAARKADEILDKAISLDENPYRGRVVDQLTFLEIEHRYLLYQYTPRKSVKIIYFIDESSRTVYVTDFFGNEMDDKKIAERNK